MAQGKIDRSDGLGILYFWIRLFAHVPRTWLREILMIDFIRGSFFYLFKYLMSKQLKTRDEFPEQVQKDKHSMMMAMFNVSVNTMKNAKTKHVKRQRIQMFLDLFLTRVPQIEGYKEKYGTYPPGFLVIGIGKYCNLKCTGCFANSDSEACEKLEWDVLDKIITQKKELWGSRFTVITGGEPLIYRSQGKDLFDLAEKHSDQLFVFFTNGTLITQKVVDRLNELGNISPAISVEGYEKETDGRRGKGVYAKIQKAMKLLKDNGVGFGISVTAINSNADMLGEDEIWDYYFKEIGVDYSWMFQYMPIGREKTLEMLVTPQQRLKLFKTVKRLMEEKKYFMGDFWSSGSCVEGCISAGRYGGYLYIDWNGNVAPCAFNPYSPVNIYEAFKEGKTLNDVVQAPFFKAIRDWQADYGLTRPKDKIGNWITCCPSKDNYKDLRPIIDKYKPMPLDEAAAEALEDDAYKEGLIQHGKDLDEVFDPVWQEEYLASCKGECGSCGAEQTESKKPSSAPSST